MIPGSPFDHAAAVPRPLSPRAKPATPVSPHGKASPDLDDDLCDAVMADDLARKVKVEMVDYQDMRRVFAPIEEHSEGHLILHRKEVEAIFGELDEEAVGMFDGLLPGWGGEDADR